ncbi:MAG TPA: hypothetical protein VGV89_04320 [Thermoplasmata archaeon]|nr:hypothetical protein [Thermoplasmata archaeon]
MADYYSRLLELRRAEGATRGLSKIPSDFYVQARAYLAEVRRTYETELRENPSGRKGEVARQTHTRALQIARDLVEARTTKVLSAAFQAAVGGAREVPNGLPEERVLFDRLVETLKEFRLSATPYLEAGTAAPATARAPERPAASPGPSTAPPSPGVPATSGARVAFVRVLKASPPLEVGGESLELRKEDVLSVTPEVAKMLVEGKLAERILTEDRELLG